MRGTNRPWMYGEDPTPDDLFRSGYLKKTKTCGVPGCTRPRAPRGRADKRKSPRKYCHAHAMHIRRYGAPRKIGLVFRQAKTPQETVDKAWKLYLGGCSQAEVGKALGVSIDVAHRLIARAKRERPKDEAPVVRWVPGRGMVRV